MTIRQSIFSGMRRSACVALAGLCSLGAAGCVPGLPTVEANRHGAGEVMRVIDGDTIDVARTSGKTETVRLIGIDTPETKRPDTPVECGGREATHSMIRLAFGSGADGDGDGLFDRGEGGGRRVTLRTDRSQDRRDRYGRLLAYVKLRGGAQLNLTQVRRGWAETYVFADRPFRLADRFHAAQRRAADLGRGAWTLCGGSFHTPAR
jgi:micrococcal nuclease